MNSRKMDPHKKLLCLITIVSIQLCQECLAKRPNILFFAADDMRPQLGCYEGSDFPAPVHPKMHTPNLDNLAKRSLLLKRAYVQQALCAPSRTSLLTGRRPDTTHVYDFVHYWRKSGGNFTTIPQYFKDNGYRSIGMGKIFHPGIVSSGGDDPISWSEPYFQAPTFDYWDTKNVSWAAIDNETISKIPLPDMQVADHAIKTLRRVAPAAKSGDQPFFVAVGFYKPHLPFVFPDTFLDFYKDVKLPDNPYAPVNMPPLAWYDYGGLRQYHDIKALGASGAINTTLPDDVVIALRRAYYSATSYTDSLIGSVLEELKSLGLDENTIVSFWGDHGWQLGEHGEWCKFTNFELSTHAPMMVSVPGVTDHGPVAEEMAEFVDLFPTLVDAAGLPSMPLCPENSTNIKVCREGSSLLPLISNPKLKNWKTAAFSQFPRGANEQIMGYTMRTDRYRYTEWIGYKSDPVFKPVWDDVHAVELYDHLHDPEENWNHASETDYSKIRKDLHDKLIAGWRADLPNA